MTFEEYKKYCYSRHYGFSDKYIKDVFYNMGPWAWTSDLYTKELKAVSYKLNQIRYYELTVEEENKRASDFYKLHIYNDKLKKQKEMLEQIKLDF